VPTLGRLRYLESLPSPGTRPRGTLLLIHGFPLSPVMWNHQMTLASRGWRVIAADLTTNVKPDATVDDYAGDVIDLLDGLHVQDAVVCGLSMGGYVTFALLRHAARYVRGLILADTRSQADTPEGVEGRRKMLTLLREQGPAAIADQMMPKLLGETTRATKPDVAEQLRGIILANSSEFIAGAINALMTRPDATPQLATIHVPTLVVVGEEDVLTPPALSEEIGRAHV
jgi:3-oxoadipate enol-lactonase